VAAHGDHRIAFPRYQAAHRPLADDKQRIGLNVRLIVPKTTGGRLVRNTLARLPLMRLARRLTPVSTPQALPDYVPAMR
jgi:hypothetical protein